MGSVETPDAFTGKSPGQATSIAHADEGLCQCGLLLVGEALPQCQPCPVGRNLRIGQGGEARHGEPGEDPRPMAAQFDHGANGDGSGSGRCVLI